MRTAFYRSEFIWYYIGVFIRIIWTLFYFQHGYIHPDEFFQGPEIVFDDIFQTNLTRTHEFNSTAPLRSVAILYLLYGPPVYILSQLSSILHWSSVSFHLKLMFPRAIILLLSLCADIIFYRLIKLFYSHYKSKQCGIMMNYYGIAHVILVFFTRTLSNSFEAFLSVALIYCVHVNVQSLLSIAMKSSNEVRTKIKLTQNTVAQSNDQSIHMNLTSLLIGLICALGIFNRPTFPAFAFVPIVYWLTSIIPLTQQPYRCQLIVSRILSCIVGTFILISCLCILFDSYYYSNNSISFITDLKNHLVICPLNFILYNTDSRNLNLHGLHPPWLHFIVNATILYGPLHLCIVVWSLFQMLNIKSHGQYLIGKILKYSNMKTTKARSSGNSISLFSFYLYWLPLIFLSTFPHQEPRFLLPLIFPLILFILPLLIQNNVHVYLFRIWFAFNIFITIIYGHLHQGGLLPTLRYIHDSSLPSFNGISMINNMNKRVVITYHTYMPPGYLVTRMTNAAEEQNLQTIIIDLKGSTYEQLNLTIQHTLNQYSMNDNLQVFVVMPSISRLQPIDMKQDKYSFKLLKQFGPHLDLDHGFDDLNHIEYPWIQTLRTRYKLDLYEIIRL